ILETTNTPNTTSATNPAPSAARVAPPALQTNSIPSAAKILTEAALALSAVGTPGATGVSTQATIVSQPLPLNPAKKMATPEPKEIRAEKIGELSVPKTQTQSVNSARNFTTEKNTPLPVVATQPLSNPRHFMLIGASLLVVVVALIFFLLRNSRGKNQPSLISRSMKPPQK
ncbi:MAG: hypothetical protein ABIQ35_06925, partial [Verrucomicrobiota bacterium]